MCLSDGPKNKRGLNRRASDVGPQQPGMLELHRILYEKATTFNSHILQNTKEVAYNQGPIAAALRGAPALSNYWYFSTGQIISADAIKMQAPRE